MPKLQSKLQEKLYFLLNDYNDKIFNASCKGEFQQVRCYLEIRKVLEEIIKVCQDRGRF